MQRIPYCYLFFLMLLASCAPSAKQDSELTDNLEKSVYHARFDLGALQQVRWLQGAWKGKNGGHDLQESIRFIAGQGMEITTEDGSVKTAMHFNWKNGHFFYGENRQWLVTWISDKNIHFDPLAPGLKPMTWSKVSDNTWHFILHGEKNDEIIEMIRCGELPS